MSSAPLAWSGVRNVLCVALDAVHDVLLAAPAIRAIKEAKPDRRITLLTSRAGAGVARLIPGVDDVVCYDAPWAVAGVTQGGSTSDLTMVERLRVARFGGAVIFTAPGRSAIAAALLCHLADIPLRTGYSREETHDLLTTRLAEDEARPASESAVRVERQARLAEAIGCPVVDRALALEVPDARRGKVDRLLAEPSAVSPVGAAPAAPSDVERPIPSAAEGAANEHDLSGVIRVVLDEPVEHPEESRSGA